MIVAGESGLLDCAPQLEANTRWLLTVIGVNVIIQDAEGRVVYINPVAAELLGYSAGVLDGTQSAPSPRCG